MENTFIFGDEYLSPTYRFVIDDHGDILFDEYLFKDSVNVPIRASDVPLLLKHLKLLSTLNVNNNDSVSLDYCDGVYIFGKTLGRVNSVSFDHNGIKFWNNLRKNRLVPVIPFTSIDSVIFALKLYLRIYDVS